MKNNTFTYGKKDMNWIKGPSKYSILFRKNARLRRRTLIPRILLINIVEPLLMKPIRKKPKPISKKFRK